MYASRTAGLAGLKPMQCVCFDLTHINEIHPLILYLGNLFYGRNLIATGFQTMFLLPIAANR